jgi:hypothetical protein
MGHMETVYSKKIFGVGGLAFTKVFFPGSKQGADLAPISFFLGIHVPLAAMVVI